MSQLPCTVELVVRGYCDLSKPTSTGQTDACEGPSEDRVVRLPLLKLTDGSSIVKAIEMRPQQSTRCVEFGYITLSKINVLL